MSLQDNVYLEVEKLQYLSQYLIYIISFNNRVKTIYDIAGYKNITRILIVSFMFE